MPVVTPRFVDNAWKRGCDFIVLDLEDSVPQHVKAHARTLIKDAIHKVSKGGAEAFSRINHDTVEADLEGVVWPGLKRVKYPKTEHASEVRLLDEIITRLERERGITPGSIEIDCGIETALGTANVYEIAAASPRVKEFGPASLKLAAKYLEDGALTWVREKSCVNCHTTGPYLAERTAWTKQFGPASEEVHKDFVGSVPKEVKPVKETETRGHQHYPSTFYSVWRSLGLAEWDRNITGKLSEPTERALRDLFERQSANGAFVSHGEVEIPHITTDFGRLTEVPVDLRRGRPRESVLDELERGGFAGGAAQRHRAAEDAV